MFPDSYLACVGFFAGWPQPDREYRTFPQRADNVGPAAVAIDDVLDDREAQPGSAHRPRAGGIDAIEPLGQPRQVLAPDALTVIAHGDSNERRGGAAPLEPCRDFDHRAFVAVFDRVIEEVLEDLGELVRFAERL